MASVRPIIEIDEEKCTGCGECIPNCPEGALQIIDGKARLVSDLFCDGLGACIGHCPEGAITVEEREAEPYDERKVMVNVVRGGPNVIRAHLEHLRTHGATDLVREAEAFLEEQGIPLPEAPAAGCQGTCPSARIAELLGDETEAEEAEPAARAGSRLGHWPVQIALVPPHAPFLQGARLVIAADCTPFAYANFHEDFLRGRAVLVGCPKLDDPAFYRQKLAMIFEQNDLESIEVVHMEVPCCTALVRIVQQALADVGRAVPVTFTKIGIQGDILERTEGATEAGQ